MLYRNYVIEVYPNHPVYVGYWIYNVRTRNGRRNVGGVANTRWGAKRLAKRAVRRMQMGA